MRCDPHPSASPVLGAPPGLGAFLAAARRHGLRAGLHCGTADYAARAVGWGFDMVTVSGDARLLAAGAAASVGRFRELAGQGPA